MDIINAFTTNSKKALIQAQILANKLGDFKIEPEHLLFSLLQQKGSIASEILSNKFRLKIESLKKIIISKARKEMGEDFLKNEIAKIKTADLQSLKNHQEIKEKIFNTFQEYLKSQELNPSKFYQDFKIADFRLSPSSKKIIQKAALCASLYKHRYVGTEHLLFGLLKTKNQTTDKFLATQKIEPEKILSQLEIVLKSTSKFFENIQTFLSNQRQNIEAHATSNSLDYDRLPRQAAALASFSLDLTAKTLQKTIDPVIGRELEIERLISILSRRTKNNPILIGLPGVGKTAIVEGLAKKINAGEVPDILLNKKIISLDLGLLVAGSIFRGEFEQRLKQLIEEVKADPNIILFIDEIHNIIGAGSVGGAMDAANLLKPALAKGEIRCIGATTPQEYKKYIEPDAALERRFQVIQIEEPNEAETENLLLGIKGNYERFHHIQITEAAIKAAVGLSARYLQDKYLPDKAIDLIDEAASSLKVEKSNDGTLKQIKTLQDRERTIVQKKEQTVREENFNQAIVYKDEQNKIQTQILELKQVLEKQQEKFLGEINEYHVAQIISKITKIPLNRLSLNENILNLEKNLKQKIIGQDEAIKQVANSIKRHSAGLTDARRPLGSFIFLGPSGVGKTELAKVMAEIIFNDPKALIRFDMSEFSQSFNISKLIGAPAGYVGYRESGKLTEAVKNKPYSLVLFDEIEKSHPEVQHILLQVLEDGRLTDATGKEINFKNTIVVMTSNIGLNELNRQQAIGFESGDNIKNQEYEKIKEKILDELKKQFNPEFLNRIDKTIVFRPLNLTSLEKIVELQLIELAKRLKEKEIGLELADKAKKFIAKYSFSPDQGARGIRKTIADFVESPLAHSLLEGKFMAGDGVMVEYKDKKLVLLKE